MRRFSEDEPKPEITEDVWQKRLMVWKILAAMLAGFVVATTLLLLILWIVFKA